MRARSLFGYAFVGAACAAVGVAAGISQSSASSASGHPRARAVGKRAGLARAVHVDAVVAIAGGRRFATMSVDRGVLRSVAGNQLTLAEGTRQATYRTLTITVPANAVVRNDGSAAELSSLRPNELVTIRRGPKRTVVRALDASRRTRIGL